MRGAENLSSIEPKKIPVTLLQWFKKRPPGYNEGATNLDIFQTCLQESQKLRGHEKAWKKLRKVELPPLFTIESKDVNSASVAQNFQKIMDVIYRSKVKITEAAESGFPQSDDPEEGFFIFAINIPVSDIVHPVWHEEDGMLKPYIRITKGLESLGTHIIERRYDAVTQTVQKLFEKAASK
jgi:hypothetical protein